MKKIILGLIVLALCACNAEKRFDDFSIKNPDKFKALAAVLAPCIDLNPKSDTIYRSHVDTLLTAGKTIIERRNDTVFVTTQLPGKIITKTDVQTVTKTVADSRVVDALNIKIAAERDRANKAETKLEDKAKAKKIWMLIAIGCMAVIAVYGSIKIYGAFMWVGKVFH